MGKVLTLDGSSVLSVNQRDWHSHIFPISPKLMLTSTILLCIEAVVRIGLRIGSCEPLRQRIREWPEVFNAVADLDDKSMD